MTIQVRLLGPDDMGLLDKVDQDVFDNPNDRATALEFLQDRRQLLLTPVTDRAAPKHDDP